MQSFLQILAPIGTLFHYVFYEPVYNVLMVLYEAVAHVFPAGAFAIAIVVLTLILRGCMIPLTRKQLRSSRAMQVLQPKLKELQARYKNDPQGLMQAQQALYKEHGVNPVSGCLPLLIQMPFLYALYDSFFTALKPASATETAAQHLLRINADLYPFVPHLHALPITTFFWTDLATPDPWHILPVVAAALTFIQLRMAMPVRKPAPAGQRQDSMTQATSTMQYIMPFFTLFIGWTFPAGLALYWCVSTLFSAVQQYFISGLGSLFVGVPPSLLAKLHLPEPKEVATPTTVTPSKSASSAGAARGAPTPASTAPAPATGGLKGMFKQLREQMASAQASALVAQQEKAKQAQGARNDISSEAETVDSGRNGNTGAVAAPAAPRERPKRNPKGPMLVKPSQPKAELPEDAIRRDATEPEPFAEEPLPEVAIAQAGSGNGNGNGNRNGVSGNNGTTATGKRPAAAGVNSSGTIPSNRSQSGQQRKGTHNTGKGAQSARSRSGRPKGGR